VDGFRRPTALGIRSGRYTGNTAIGSTSQRLGTGVRWNPLERKPAVKVSNIEDAYDEIRKGNYVTLDTGQQVHTMIKDLNDYVAAREAQGDNVGNLDLCRVSIPGTNLFCGSSVATDRHPEGIPRQEMPQLSGIPLPGSRASELKAFDNEGNVDIAGALMERLAEQGIKTTEKTVSASSLKASQHQLKGKTVSFFLTPRGQKILDDPTAVIYVSNDGYVIDGHHRWAGKIAQDLANGRTGDAKIKVRVIDMPIMEVLDAALDHAEYMGIRPNTV